MLHSSKHRHKLLTIIVVLGMILSSFSILISSTGIISASGGSWLDDWGYRKSQDISPSSGAGTNYPILFHLYFGSGTDTTETYLGIPASKIYLNSHAQDDFDDIRFTDDDGSTLLDYYIENYTAYTQATVWVEVADDLSSSAQTIYLYYGNALATSASNGTNTFLFFDDFSGTSLDGSKWTTSGTPSTTFDDGKVSITKASQTWAYVDSVSTYGPETQFRGNLKIYQTTPGVNTGASWGYKALLDWVCYDTTVRMTRFNGTNVIHTYDTSYHVYSSNYQANSMRFQKDGTDAGAQPQTKSLTTFSRAIHLGVINLSPGLTADWVMVRKAIATEPAHSTIGNQESSLTPIITSTPILVGEENQTYSYQAVCSLSVSSWNVSGASFLSINSTGYISGTPTVGTAGTYSVVLSATTSEGTAYGNYSLTINAAPKYADWFDDNWQYRKSHTVGAVSSITYSGYQIPIMVYYGTGSDGSYSLGDMVAGKVYLNNLGRSDFTDIRFVDENNIDRLPFWIESQTNSDNALFWVRLNGSLTSSQTIYIYYGNPNATVSASNGELTFDFFEDYSSNGNVWTKKGLAIATNGGATSASLGFWEPTVLWEPEAQVLDVDSSQEVFKIWYRHMVVGSPNVNTIYYAESLDGYNWTHYASNPVLGVGNAYPNVYKVDGTYYLIVSKYATTTNYDIYTSSNGISWALAKSDALVSGGSSDWDNLLGNVFVWKEGTDSWYMTYEATISGAIPWNVGLATSTDGLTWTKYGSNPVIGSSSYDVGNPQVFKFDGTYYMAYHGCHASGLPTDFGWATSTDLHTWTIIGTTMERTWEGLGSSAQIGDPTYVEAMGMSWVYYAANPDQTNFYGIGVAISGLTIKQLCQTRQNMTNTLTTQMVSNSGTNTMTGGVMSTYGGASTWSSVQSIDAISSLDTAMRVRVDTTGAVADMNTGYQIALNLTGSDANRIDFLHANTGTISTLLRSTSDGVSWSQTTSNWNNGAYETLEIGRNATSTAFRRDNTLLVPLITTNIPTGDLRVLLSSIGGSDYSLNVDFLLIRAYSATEPDQATWGTMQYLGSESIYYDIISSPVTTGNVGVAYVYQAQCNGTVTSWNVSGASFLSVNATGYISGTPATGDVGSYSIVLSAVTSENTAYQNYTLEVEETPFFTSAPITTIYHGFGYYYEVNTSEEVISWSISGGGAAIHITESGIVYSSGTGIVGTIYTLSINATTADGTYWQNYTLTVIDMFTSSPVTTGKDGIGYSYQVTTHETPIEYSIDGPDWLSISASGLVTGTPPIGAAGEYEIWITTVHPWIEDPAGATQVFTLTILPNAAYAITSDPVTNATANETYEYQVTSRYAVTSWNITGADWLTINATGMITGTAPNGTAGSYNISVLLTLYDGTLAYQNYTLDVEGAPLSFADGMAVLFGILAFLMIVTFLLSIVGSARRRY